MTARTSIVINDPTRDILIRAIIDGNKLMLPEQLDRATYQRINKVLVAAGGKWDRKARAHVFARPPSDVINELMYSNTVTHVKNTLQAFYTPTKLAERVVSMAEIKPKHRVLEPSAGEGAIANVIRQRHADAVLHVMDIDPHAVQKLIEQKFKHRIQGDFLNYTPARPFDRIVMNPPFSKGQDIAHVTHAHGMLAEGGKLVAIMSPGWCNSNLKRARAFASLVREHGLWVGPYREQFGDTEVGIVLVTLNHAKH